MGRIEDALRKLEQQRRTPAAQTADSEARPTADVAMLAPFTFETANRVALDGPTLRRWGPVAMLFDEERAKREYGQIKRPIINLALGRTADAPRGGNIVVVTSATSGEGKSLTAFNLAVSVAREKDLSVLLVDGDMAKPDLSRTLGLAGSRGLTDLIVDQRLQLRDVLWKTSVDRLYFIPAGLERTGATELLGSQRMRSIVGSMADLPHTIVIIDSSPLLLTNESPVLVSLAGQTVLVVRANETPRSLVGEAIARLDVTKPLGLVLNGAYTEAKPYYASSGGGDAFEPANHESREGQRAEAVKQ